MKNYDEIIKSANDTMMQLHQMVLESHEKIERLKKEEEIMKVDFREQDNGLILETSQKMFTKILDVQEQETIKAALKYCEENDLIPNIIDKDKLDMVLKLGIQALAEREINNGSIWIRHTKRKRRNNE